jgi:hypothetical protein
MNGDIKDPVRRHDNPDHPYWQFVDECVAAYKEGNGEAPEIDFDLDLLIRFPEVDPKQFSHDVEITILRSY